MRILPSPGGNDTENLTDERCLSASVGPDKRDCLAVIDGERDVVIGLYSAGICLRDILYSNFAVDSNVQKISNYIG